MIEYLSQNLWLLWTMAAMLCLIVELGSGDFYVTCFAIGALCSVLAAFVGLSFPVQVLVFALCSVLSIFFIRPSLLKWLHAKSSERLSNADALIGSIGRVVEPITPGDSGYVKIDGDNWKAVSTTPQEIEIGAEVRVVSRASIILTVEPV